MNTNILTFIIGIITGCLSFIISHDLIYSLTIAFLSGVASFIGQELIKFIYNSFKK